MNVFQYLKVKPLIDSLVEECVELVDRATVNRITYEFIALRTASLYRHGRKGILSEKITIDMSIPARPFERTRRHRPGTVGQCPRRKMKKVWRDRESGGEEGSRLGVLASFQKMSGGAGGVMSTLRHCYLGRFDIDAGCLGCGNFPFVADA